MTKATVDAGSNARRADRLADVLARMAGELDRARQEEGVPAARALAAFVDDARRVARLLPASMAADRRQEMIADLAGRLWRIRPPARSEGGGAPVTPGEGTRPRSLRSGGYTMLVEVVGDEVEVVHLPDEDLGGAMAALSSSAPEFYDRDDDLARPAAGRGRDGGLEGDVAAAVVSAAKVDRRSGQGRGRPSGRD